MARTTLLIDDAVLLEIKGIARAQQRTLTEVVSEALAEYAVRQGRRPLPSFTAAGCSSTPRSVAEDAEEILRAQADSREGW